MTTRFSFRPPTFINLPDKQLKKELDSSIPRLYDAHASLDGIAIKAPTFGGGFNVSPGSTTVTGSKLGIATGLASVIQVTASLDSGGIATNLTVTAQPSKATTGAVDIYVWQPTSASVTTPIAATTPVTVRWWATGAPATVGGGSATTGGSGGSGGGGGGSGSSAPTFTDLSSLVNGVTTVFTLGNIYSVTILSSDGFLLIPNVGYTISGTTLTMAVAPVTSLGIWGWL